MDKIKTPQNGTNIIHCACYALYLVQFHLNIRRKNLGTLNLYRSMKNQLRTLLRLVLDFRTYFGVSSREPTCIMRFCFYLFYNYSNNSPKLYEICF